METLEWEIQGEKLQIVPHVFIVVMNLKGF